MVYRIATRSAQEPTPEAKAASIIDALPGNSLVSKTTWVTIGAGLTAFAVSNELYVANDETVILAGFLVFATLIGRTVSKPYANWANSYIEKISNILNEARQGHTKAIQTRIDAVNEKKDVVDITKAMYAVAKETVQAEKEAFELKQKTQLAAEVKAVLDSWVRFEAQEREAEQALLTETVIKKVADSLRDDKAQKQILDNAVSEIEQLVKSKKI
ncbi:atp4 subunit B of the stator stalk of mitochondrial F1F0 ATP synthase [Malassezia nana]|uniref:ATP synthase subunit 4 n=1 Tax=Malassezia nana TaxID=180528 RepID=A0AAF0EJA7_9BASI|nr:atp4 subunit B of the stator stalk of mitochondrial F1F0 ATP synthase [Malassezia nana]